MGHGFFAMFTQGPKGIFQWSTSSTSTFNRWSRGFSGRHGKAPGTGSRRLVTLAEAQSRPWQPVGPKGPRDGGKPMAFPWKMIPMLANSQPKQWFLNWTYTKKASEFPGKSCFVQVWKWKWRFHQHQCLFHQENWWLNMVEPWWTYILLKYNKHIETIGSQPLPKKSSRRPRPQLGWFTFTHSKVDR